MQRSMTAGVGRHGFEDFENDGMARQQLQHVAEQKLLVDIDEASATAERRLDSQFRESVGDHRGGRLDAIGHFGKIAAAVAEQEFVSEQPLVAVQNGLASQE
jgi:hypothetical protein